VSVAGTMTARTPIIEIQRSRFMKSSSLELRDCSTTLPLQKEATPA
jgi:hypothetical protein